MYYVKAITITAGTTEAAPVEETLKVTKGIIHRVEVEFYPGPRRYASVRILFHDHQVWPTNPDTAFSTDGYTIAFDEYLDVSSAPLDLIIQGYAPDADYNHVVTIRIGLLESRGAVMLLAALKGMLKLFKIMGIKV